MNKKVVYLALLSVVIMAIGINISHQAFIWGFETISGGDGLAHFSRANTIAGGYVDLRHDYDNPQFFDLYPSGFHVLLAMFTILSGSSPFAISMIFKMLSSTIGGILIFLIGAKINWKVGVFSSFFVAISFSVFTSRRSFYIYIASGQNYLGGGSITTITTFIILLAYISFLKTKDNELKFGLLILIMGTIQGISHISTYIGFIVNFIGFSIFVLPLIFFRYRYLFTKVLKIIFYTLLSLPAVFFIYYFPMYPQILSPGYLPEKFFPSFVPAHYTNYFPILFSLMLISLVFFLIFINVKSEKGSISYFKTNKYIFTGMFVSYILLYSLVLFMVTKSPHKYTFSSFVILTGIFPTYLPHSYPGMVSAVSLFTGFMMFGLTIAAFFYSYRSKYVNAHFILLMYFSFYAIWFVFAIIIRYYADRIIYFGYFLPLLYGLGLVSFFSSKTLNHRKYGKILKKSAVLGIAFLFLSMSIMSQITKEPQIRPDLNVERINIGSHAPPRTISSFSYAVSRLTEPGEYILSSPETLEVMATTTHIRSPTNHWSQAYRDHTNWGITSSALYGRNMGTFFEKYHARYLIVGYGDMTSEMRFSREKHAPIQTYNKNPHLMLIYIDQYGERIYEWIGS